MRQRVERRDREWDCERDPLSALTHADAAAHAQAVSPWVRDAVKLAFPSWSCRHRESVTASCYRRWDPRETHLPPSPPVARSAQPSFFASAFTVHRYLLLSFPSKPNKMFVTLWSENLRFIESRNCACVVWTCGVSIFMFEFSVLVLWIMMNCACLCGCYLWFFFFFFGFLALWLCHSMFVTSLYR